MPITPKPINITVDLTRPGIVNTQKEMRYGDKNLLTVEVTQGGEVIDLATIGAVTTDLVVKRLGSTNKDVLGSIVDGKAVFTVDGDSLAKPGRTEAVIQFYDADGARISTATFAFTTLADPSLTAVGDVVEQTIIQQVLVDGPQVIADAEDKLALMDEAVTSTRVEYKGVLADDAALTAVTGMQVGDWYRITTSAANGGLSRSVRYDGTTWVTTDLQDPNVIATVTAQLDETNEELLRAPKGKPNTKYKILAGAIRNSAGVWSFIEDVSHAKTGFAGVSISGTSIRVDHEETASKVSSLVVTLDETMASQGIRVGASVALGYSLIDIYKDFSCLVSNTGITISPILAPKTSIAFNVDNSGFVITHLSTGDTSDYAVISLLNDSSARDSIEARVRTTNTTITVDVFDYINGEVSNDGTTITTLTNNIQPPNVTFSAGVFTINHLGVHDNSAFSVVGMDGNYIYEVIQKGNNFFRVRVKDLSGNVVTTLNPAMKFSYVRMAKTRSVLPSSSRILIRRGGVKVAPEDLIVTNSNFWLLGLQEVV